MREFVMTVGISASGKSTWAYAQEDYVVLDSDKIRGEIYGDETCQDNPDKVFNLMYKRVILALSRGESIIYCATNLTMKHRIHLLNQLRNQFPDIYYRCVIFNTPVEICHKMNKQRERQVPDWLFERQVKQFQCPVVTEGFDNIEIIAPFEYNQIEFAHSMWNDVRAAGSQDNPHHTLTLYDHLQACIVKLNLVNLSVRSSYWGNLYMAAALHDVGKAYTRSYDENGIAHYYSHAEYGAYTTMNMRCNLEVIQLVNYHMLPFDINAISTWKKRLGEDLWNKIMILHKADLAAH